MSQIIAVSKEGKNVLTATNPNEFIFHSNYNTLKIIAQGTHQYTLGITQYSVSSTEIYHFQPIIPLVFAYVKYNGKVHMTGNRISNRPTNDGFLTDFVDVNVDNTFISFVYTNNVSNVTVIFKYYIFEVPL